MQRIGNVECFQIGQGEPCDVEVEGTGAFPVEGQQIALGRIRIEVIDLDPVRVESVHLGAGIARG